MMSRCVLILTMLCLVAVPTATVRGAEPGRPAVVAPGGVFGAFVGVGETVTLVGASERYSLSVEAPVGGVPVGTGRVRVPDTVSPGRYTLLREPAAEATGRAVVVHVIPEFPESYTVAVVRRDVDGEAGMPTFSADLVSQVAASDAALVFLVGALTRDGTAASYTALDTQWSALSVPVFYCPDADELARCRAAGNSLAADHAFAFGKDGYMLFGAGLSQHDVGVDGRMGTIQRWRRALRASRWSVGVAGRFGLDWSIRAQLVLFVDDPLDYLISGEMMPGVGETLPWGRTRYAIPPTVPSVPMQLIAVDGGAMRAVVASAGSEVPEVSATE